MSRLSNLIASENLFSSSVLPIFLDACTICRINSSSLLMDLMTLPAMKRGQIVSWIQKPCKEQHSRTFEKFGHFADLGELCSLAPLEHDVHHEGFELSNVLLLVEFNLGLLGHLGYPLGHVLHLAKRPRQLLSQPASQLFQCEFGAYVRLLTSIHSSLTWL